MKHNQPLVFRKDWQDWSKPKASDFIPRRPVKIERIGDSWLVFYADRSKGQRYTAAQFYAQNHTLEDVENYIKTKPNLTLVNPQN